MQPIYQLRFNQQKIDADAASLAARQLSQIVGAA